MYSRLLPSELVTLLLTRLLLLLPLMVSEKPRSARVLLAEGILRGYSWWSVPRNDERLRSRSWQWYQWRGPQIFDQWTEERLALGSICLEHPARTRSPFASVQRCVWTVCFTSSVKIIYCKLGCSSSILSEESSSSWCAFITCKIQLIWISRETFTRIERKAQKFDNSVERTPTE